MNRPLQDLLVSRRGVAVWGASLFTLSACGSLIGPQNAPPQMYVLAPALPDAGTLKLPWQMVVARPDASASLSSDRIALKRGESFDYYADAQWTDGVPVLLQDLMVRALDRAGAAGSIARDTDGVRGDYILEAGISSFEARYEGGDSAPRIAIDVAVKLVNVQTASIAAATSFHEESEAAANSVAAVVAAFDTGTAALLADIVRWLADRASSLPRVR